MTRRKKCPIYFDWSASAVKRLKEQFPNLKKVMIEDDYLPQKQMDELPGYLAPVVVEWVQRHYIDGRDGR